MKTIDKIITKLNTQFGAPMGRASKGIKPVGQVRVFDCKVPMCAGGYDKGGAYWGIGSELRVSYTKDLNYIHFYRISELLTKKQTI